MNYSISKRSFRKMLQHSRVLINFCKKLATKDILATKVLVTKDVTSMEKMITSLKSMMERNIFFSTIPPDHLQRTGKNFGKIDEGNLSWWWLCLLIGL